MRPNRPLKILVVLIVLLAPVYFLSMRYAKVTGVWEKRPKEDSVQDNNRNTKMRIEGSTLKLLMMAFYFSALSAFNIGWRDLNVGNWLARLQSHEFTLYCVGWVRSLSGFQSLISVYLMALWVLTYFGRAFG